MSSSSSSINGADDRPDERQLAFWAKLTPGQRLDRAMAMIRSTRRFQTACVRAQHPEWTEEQITAEIRRRWSRRHPPGFAVA